MSALCELSAFGRISARALQGPFDVQCASFQIDVGPLQAQCLAETKSASQRDCDKCVKGMRGRLRQEALRLLRIKRHNLTSMDARRVNERRNILSDERPAPCRVERTSQDNTSVSPTTDWNVSGFKSAEPRLYLLRRQSTQPMLAEVRDDVTSDGCLVGVESPRSDAKPRDVREPALQELLDGLPLVCNQRPVLCRP